MRFRSLCEAQFPIAVVVGHDGSSAQAFLQRVAGLARDLGGGLLQRHLHLGKCRERHAQRHQIVKNAILAQIGVGQHIVANGLAVPKPRAVAHHEPAIGP